MIRGMIGFGSGIDARLPSLPRVACIGSSYTQQQIDSTSSLSFLRENNRSWMKWWHIFSGGAFNMDDWSDSTDPLGRYFRGSNFGVSGQTSTQILARIPTMLASRADVFIIQQGSNNVTAVETVVADIKSALSQVKAAGKIAVYLAISARTTASWTDTEQLDAWQINQRIRDYIRRTGVAIWVDPNEYICDNTANSGRPYSGALNSDGIHYNQFSAFWIGKALHAVVTPLLPGAQPFVTSYSDKYDATYNKYGNIFVNPFVSTDSNVGTSNGTVGTGITAGSGSAATSVGRNMTVERSSGTGTATANIESRGSGKGNWQTLVCTPSGSGQTLNYIRRASADELFSFTAGDWYQASMDIDVSAFGTDPLYSGFNNIGFQLDFRTASASTFTNVTLYPESSATTNNLPNVAWSGRLISNPCQIPAGTDRVRWRTDIMVDDTKSGTGTVKIGSVCIRKVQEPKTLWGV